MSLVSEMGPADLAAVTGNGNGNNGFFGNGSWWVIILFLFVLAGWNNNGGWNGNGSGGGYVSDNYTLISDMGQLERKIDTVNAGLCDGFYSTAQLINGVNMQNANNTAAIQNTLTQGFAGINTGMIQQANGITNAITQDTIANLQGFNGIQAAVKDCCCNTQSGMKDINYNLATQANGVTNAVNTGFCQTNFNNQQNTRDILENQNANARAILDAIQANKVEALKDRISEQNQTINALNLAASQTAQNAYLIEKLNPNPCPQPAYVVQPPQQVTFPNYTNGCGCNC